MKQERREIYDKRPYDIGGNCVQPYTISQVCTHNEPSTLTVIHGAQLELSVHPALLCCLLEVFQCQLIVLKTKDTELSSGSSDYNMSDALLASFQNKSLIIYLNTNPRH